MVQWIARQVDAWLGHKRGEAPPDTPNRNNDMAVKYRIHEREKLLT